MKRFDWSPPPENPAVPGLRLHIQTVNILRVSRRTALVFLGVSFVPTPSSTLIMYVRLCMSSPEGDRLVIVSISSRHISSELSVGVDPSL
jgi:hypothetical protein